MCTSSSSSFFNILSFAFFSRFRSTKNIFSFSKCYLFSCTILFIVMNAVKLNRCLKSPVLFIKFLAFYFGMFLCRFGNSLIFHWVLFDAQKSEKLRFASRKKKQHSNDGQRISLCSIIRIKLHKMVCCNILWTFCDILKMRKIHILHMTFFFVKHQHISFEF